MPGWLAEAMPGWPRRAAQARAGLVGSDGPRCACHVRAGVGRIVAGRREIGLVLAIGALLGTVTDPGGPYVVRVKLVVTAAVLGGVPVW